ncbi:MAG: lysine exporter LysO family protein [Thermofilum sp.]
MDAGASSLAVLALFAVSVGAGKLSRVKPPAWVFEGIILVVVFSVSCWAASSGVQATVSALILAAALLSLIVSLTLAASLISKSRGKAAEARFSPRIDWRILSVVLAGWLSGFLAPYLSEVLGSLLFWEVMVLIAITGLYVSSSLNHQALREGARTALEACALAVAISVLAGLVGSQVLGIPPDLAVAMTLGMGWYSFTGPYIASVAGPSAGLAAFLLNVMREQSTFLLVPLVRGPRSVMLSLGGVTTMDNTLPVYIHAYGEDFAPASVLHGFILTVLAPFLIVAALSF